MGRALILHIGHHRTGTTTLQKLVFPQLTTIAYFCKDATPASAQVIDAFGHSPAVWRYQGEKIFRQLIAEVSESHANGAALISAEHLSSHRIFVAPGALLKNRVNQRRDPFLLAAHLRECQAVAQRSGFDSVKIIMGIRRQDQYLASRYACGGWDAAKPQDDFERQALEMLDPNKRYFLDGMWLDYKMTRDLIAEAVGEYNVLVLPLEQLHDEPSSYFSSLFAFLGETVNSNSLTPARKNSRSVAPDVWHISQTAMRRSARTKCFGSLRALVARPTEIRLSPELKEMILAAYRDSNQSLASALNLDLAAYGYCQDTSLEFVTHATGATRATA